MTYVIRRLGGARGAAGVASGAYQRRSRPQRTAEDGHGRPELGAAGLMLSYRGDQLSGRVCAGGGDWLLTCHAVAGACPFCPGQVRLRAAGLLMPAGPGLAGRGLLRPKAGARQSIGISVFAAAVVALPARRVRPGGWHA
jgi:hypothetical protein